MRQGHSLLLENATELNLLSGKNSPREGFRGCVSISRKAFESMQKEAFRFTTVAASSRLGPVRDAQEECSPEAAQWRVCEKSHHDGWNQWFEFSKVYGKPPINSPALAIWNRGCSPARASRDRGVFVTGESCAQGYYYRFDTAERTGVGILSCELGVQEQGSVCPQLCDGLWSRNSCAKTEVSS